MPASAPAAADSDVFSTPFEPTEPPIGGGPLDEAGPPDTDSTRNDFDAEPVVASATPADSDGAGSDQSAPEVIAEASSATAEDGDEPWQSEATEVSDFSDEIALESETDPGIDVDFGEQNVDELLIEPPPMKRVHLSNQLDILAELEGLRSGSFSDGVARQRPSSAPEIDIDLLISGAMGGAKEIRRRIERELDSEVFEGMRGIEVTVRVKDAGGDTVHTLEPMMMEVEGAGKLTKLSLRFAIDLENSR